MLGIAFLSVMMQVLSVSAQSKALMLLPGEKWWGGAVTEGQRMPFEAGYSLDLNEGNRGNQAAPLLLSSAGRWVWSEQPFEFTIGKDSFILSKCKDSVFIGQAAGHTLDAAYREAASRYFPASGKMPDSLLIIRPQYNTWIELIYNQNQSDILKYSRAVIVLDSARIGFPMLRI